MQVNEKAISQPIAPTEPISEPLTTQTLAAPAEDDDNTDAIRLYLSCGYELWQPEPIETYREIFRDDGSIDAVPDEPCLVYVRRRATDGGR